MPLDPEMRRVVDRVADWDAQHGPLSRIEQQRRRTPSIRSSVWFPEMLSVESIVKRRIPGPGGPLGVRVYRPTLRRPLPTVLYFHGGGWTGGDLNSHESHARRICNRVGAVVVAVDYRLAPEHPYPAAADDALAALEWAHTNISALGGDPGRLAVAGDSTGGALAAALAVDARERLLPLAAQLLIYPVTDLARSYPSMREVPSEYALAFDPDIAIGADYLVAPTQAWEPRASPILADLAGVAPAVVIAAEYDPLRDQGTAYAERLTAAGVRTRYRLETGLLHSFASMGASSSAVAASNRFCQDLAELLPPGLGLADPA